MSNISLLHIPVNHTAIIPDHLNTTIYSLPDPGVIMLMIHVEHLRILLIILSPAKFITWEGKQNGKWTLKNIPIWC